MPPSSPATVRLSRVGVSCTGAVVLVRLRRLRPDRLLGLPPIGRRLRARVCAALLPRRGQPHGLPRARRLATRAPLFGGVEGIPALLSACRVGRPRCLPARAVLARKSILSVPRTLAAA